MVSIKIILKEKPKKDGTFSILIRIIIDRKSRYISTGHAVKKTQFRDGLENWVYKHPDAALINAAIEKKRSKYAEEFYKAEISGNTIDVNEIGKVKKGTSFTGLLLEKQTIYEKRNMVSAYDKLKLRIKNLKSAWGSDVEVSKINKYWVEKYINERYRIGASPNTIKKDLSAFSGILQNSEYTGKDYFKEQQKYIKKIPVRKEKLNREEIILLEQTTLFNLEDQARDMFLFAYYTQGMRFQSVVLFERDYIKKDNIEYRMNKGKKLREISMHPKLKAIIDKYNHKGNKNNTPYLFPCLKSVITDPWELDKEIDSISSLIRVRLKRVGYICGIKKNLTMHIAKHTFAALSLKRGVSYEILKDALGHSDYATTQMYLESLSDDEVNTAVIGLFD